MFTTNSSKHHFGQVQHKRPANQRGNGSLIVIGVVVMSILLISGLVIAFSKTSPTSAIVASSNAIAVTPVTDHDWGTISMKDGKVETFFEVKNEGTEVLKLYNATTSCTCTTAQLILGDNRSPLFGMHTKYDYILEVSPGETAQVKTVYDPAFHGPSGVGPISRQITVATNDQQQPQLTFNAVANVTP